MAEEVAEVVAEAVAGAQVAGEAQDSGREKMVVTEAAVELWGEDFVVTAAAGASAISAVCEQGNPGSLCQARTQQTYCQCLRPRTCCSGTAVSQCHQQTLCKWTLLL